MIQALNPSIALRVIVLLTLLLTGLSLLNTTSEAAKGLWADKAWIIAVVNGFVLLLTWTPALRIVHRLTWARYWWFPWLGGEWVAEIRSNWLTIERLVEAAGTKGQTFDPIAHGLVDAPPVIADVKIVPSLFHIELTLSPRGTTRTSRSIFVRPQWCKPSLPKLFYMYEQNDTGHIPRTDTRMHLGAGQVQYDPDRDVLEGVYWTERAYDRALNTAGSIVMRRAAAAA